MTTEIIPFEFNGVEVRRVDIDGVPHLVVADLARILGYRDATDAARVLREHHKGYAELRTPGGSQRMIMTNMAGFNRLVIRSNASNAEAVQDWVTDEVMVSIATTGTYTAAPTAIPAELTRMEILTLALDSERRAVTAEAANVELTPRAEAWDALASARGDYNVAEAAKILARTGIDTGPQRLFDFMQVIGWVFHGYHGRWEPYAKTVDAGYLAMKPQSHFHPRTGVAVIDPPQVRVTLKGIERLRVRLTASKSVAA